MRSRIGYADKYLKYLIIARVRIITTACASVKQLIYQIVTRTRSFVRIKFALHNYHSAYASFSIKRGTFYEQLTYYVIHIKGFVLTCQ